MKKMMRIMSVFLMLALVLCSFAGCGSGDSSDLAYVQEKGTLIVGITKFEPMDYLGEDGRWIGFDADMAAGFAKSLGVEVEFIVINWDTKEMELTDKGIDCVWNGMTLTDAVKNAMSTSNAYCKNAQVVVVNKAIAERITDNDSLKNLSFVVEAGSAGAEQLDALGISYMEAEAQADALMEVAAGTSDACVIDLLMAGAMIGEGTAYPDLTYTLCLNSEEYGVGFRQGSDLTEKLNEYLKAAYADGTMMTIAETYGVQEAIVAQ